MAKPRALAKVTASTKKGVAKKKAPVKSEEKLEGDSSAEVSYDGESQDGEADMKDEERSV